MGSGISKRREWAGVGRGVGSDEAASECRFGGIGAGGEEEVDDPDDDAVLSRERSSRGGEDDPTKEAAEVRRIVSSVGVRTSTAFPHAPRRDRNDSGETHWLTATPGCRQSSTRQPSRVLAGTLG